MDKIAGILFPMGHGMMERVIGIPITEALLNSRERRRISSAWRW